MLNISAYSANYGNLEWCIFGFDPNFDPKYLKQPLKMDRMYWLAKMHNRASVALTSREDINTCSGKGTTSLAGVGRGVI